jgi:hypothetical protein
MAKTRPYRIWTQIRRRCTDPFDKDWVNYGGRGVQVCTSWAESFEAFWDDMRTGYDPRLSVGRKDNDGPYCKENCRWETATEQSRNKRNTTYVDTPKGRMTLMDAAEAYQIAAGTLRHRLEIYKWSVDRALTTPARKRSST